MSEPSFIESERRLTSTETPVDVAPTLEDLAYKGSTDEVRRLARELNRIITNEIPHINIRLSELEASMLRGTLSNLLGLTLVLWMLTPLAFLSMPLMGFVCLTGSILSTAAYLMARRHVKKL